MQLGESEVFAVILELVQRYPWNNFIQLKVINIFEEIFENSENAAFRKEVLKNSFLLRKLVNLSDSPTMETANSHSNIRYGHMALVNRIANMVQKFKDKQEVQDAIED